MIPSVAGDLRDLRDLRDGEGGPTRLTRVLSRRGGLARAAELDSRGTGWIHCHPDG